MQLAVAGDETTAADFRHRVAKLGLDWKYRALIDEIVGPGLGSLLRAVRPLIGVLRSELAR